MNKFIHALQPRTMTTIIAFAVLINGAIVNINVHAQESDTGSRSDSAERQDTSAADEAKNQLRIQQREAREAKKQEAKEAAEARKKASREARQEKLSASKLEICKAREANINNRISRIADRSTKHLELFNKISERAQTFYLNKGNSLANYDELVADVAAKKTAAEAAVETITSTAANFDCEGDNPKVTIEEFKTSLTTAIGVLKEYRTAVKNLIVGIKSVNSTQSDASSKPAEGTE